MLNSDDSHLPKARKHASNDRAGGGLPRRRLLNRRNGATLGWRCHAPRPDAPLNHNSTVWEDRYIVDDFITQWGIVSTRVSLPYDLLRFSPVIAASVSRHARSVCAPLPGCARATRGVADPPHPPRPEVWPPTGPGRGAAAPGLARRHLQAPKPPAGTRD